MSGAAVSSARNKLGTSIFFCFWCALCKKSWSLASGYKSEHTCRYRLVTERRLYLTFLTSFAEIRTNQRYGTVTSPSKQKQISTNRRPRWPVCIIGQQGNGQYNKWRNSMYIYSLLDSKETDSTTNGETVCIFFFNYFRTLINPTLCPLTKITAYLQNSFEFGVTALWLFFLCIFHLEKFSSTNQPSCI